MSEGTENKIVGGKAGGMDRRNFMTASMAIGFGALLANFGIASMALFSPFRNGAKAQPVPVDSAKVPAKGFLSVNYGDGSAFVGKSAEGGYLVFSGNCPHMSCQVRWTDEKGRFVCPCHEGIFDAEGNVISGPPRSPLESLPYVIEGKTIIVGKVAE